MRKKGDEPRAGPGRKAEWTRYVERHQERERERGAREHPRVSILVEAA